MRSGEVRQAGSAWTLGHDGLTDTKSLFLSTMIDVKDAVRRAASELTSVLDLPPGQVLLEEVERLREDNGRSYWSVTLSYPARAGVVPDLISLGEVLVYCPANNWTEDRSCFMLKHGFVLRTLACRA